MSLSVMKMITIYMIDTVSFIDIYILCHIDFISPSLLFFYLQSPVVAAWRNSEGNQHWFQEEINKQFGEKKKHTVTSQALPELSHFETI